MANISARRNKDGKIISYRIRVSQGYTATGVRVKMHEMTWKPSPNMTERQIEKELHRQATLFEEQCRNGLAGDGRQKFEEYAAYVLEIKAKSGDLRPHTLSRYKELLVRINQGIGHLKISDIRPQHLNMLYDELSQEGLRKNGRKAVIKDGDHLLQLIRKAGFTSREKFAKYAKIAVITYRNAEAGKNIDFSTAKKISSALGVRTEEIFNIKVDATPLSAKTIKEHHRIIHMILHQAECELLIPFNPASRSKPPKDEKTEADYFEANEIADILQAAEKVPLKWRTLLHLLLVTGGRRGEVLGLTWDNINFEHHTIHIEKALYYTKEMVVYMDKPKTKKSVRYIKLPEQTIELIKLYRDEYYLPLKEACGSQWNNSNFLFVQDSGKNPGQHMHPDSATQYCDDFSKKFGLKHIHPHAFRHTSASVLYFAGMDIVSISNHLGHASPSTTQNIYAHVMAEAESRAAECMGELLLSAARKSGTNVKPASETINPK